MSFLSKLFGKKQGDEDTVIADRIRSQGMAGQGMAGRETGQTKDEQEATRGRMEKELDAQRAKRNTTP